MLLYPNILILLISTGTSNWNVHNKPSTGIVLRKSGSLHQIVESAVIMKEVNCWSFTFPPQMNPAHPGIDQPLSSSPSFPRKKRESSGRQRTMTLRTSRRTARTEWYQRSAQGSTPGPRRRMTTTWSSVGCVKTEASCCAATPAPHPTTSIVWTRRCQRSPTESGCVRDARWAASVFLHCWFRLCVLSPSSLTVDLQAYTFRIY